MKSTSKLTNDFSLLPICIVVGISTAVSVYCAFRVARRRRSTLLARTRRQAEELSRQVSDASRAAADMVEKGREEFDRQKKGLINAVEAGKKAWQRSVA